MLVFQLCFVLFLYSLLRVFQQYLAPVVVRYNDKNRFSCTLLYYKGVGILLKR